MGPRSAAAPSAEKFPTPARLTVTLFVNGVERKLAVAERFPIRKRFFSFELRVHSRVEHEPMAAHL